MHRKLTIGVLLSATLLRACASIPTLGNAPLEKIPAGAVSTQNLIKSSRSLTWNIKDVRVNVPSSLSVSEANFYIPKADIVWRGDPYGDRRRQVSDLIDLAVSQAVLGLEGNQPVFLDIRLERFHALSQKARATVGGVHNIQFDVTVRDVETGITLAGPTPVSIHLKAYGGQKAIEAEMRGETQKRRISKEITSVMRYYLGT